MALVFQPEPKLTAEESASIKNDTVSDETMKLLNRFMNYIDPPKDFIPGGHLTNLNDTKVKVLKDAMDDLFGPFPTELMSEGSYSVVGDAKGEIIKSVKARLAIGFPQTKGIVRPKHASGHEASLDRPSGLFVAQDNGSLEVVINPKLIITPGSILDPAGKTKQSNEITILNVTGDYPTLPSANFVNLAMGDLLSNVAMTKGAAAASPYTLTLNFKAGRRNALAPLVANFNSTTFVPVEGEASSTYYAGNRTKNRAIRGFLDGPNPRSHMNEIKYYIIVKELGDTLQVEWLNYIFSRSVAYKRENTVVVTTDTVVLYRCIVNKIGVIHTDSAGKSTYYLPRTLDAAAQAAINKTYVISVQTENCSKNEAIIKTLEKVKDEGILLRDTLATDTTTAPWIDTLSWTKKQIHNCVNYIISLIEKLNNYNRDLSKIYGALADPQSSQALSQRSHFSAPLVYKSGVWRKVNTVRYMLPGNQLEIQLFSPGNFNSPKTQAGGVIWNAQRIHWFRTIAAGIATGAIGGMLGALAQRMRDGEDIHFVSWPSILGAVVGAAGGALGAMGYDGVMLGEPDSADWRYNVNEQVPAYFTNKGIYAVNKATVEGYFVGEIQTRARSTMAGIIYLISRNRVAQQNPADAAFLYCFLKIHAPEIFTYAYYFLTGIRRLTEEQYNALPEALRTIVERQTTIEANPANADLKITSRLPGNFYTNELDFEFTSEGDFINNTDQAEAQKTLLKEVSINALKLAQIFIRLYIGLRTPFWDQIFGAFRQNNGTFFNDVDRIVVAYRPLLAAQGNAPSPYVVEYPNNVNRQAGGNKNTSPFDDSLDKASTIAMDLYELYYSRLEIANAAQAPVESLCMTLLEQIYGAVLNYDGSELMNAEIDALFEELEDMPKVKEKMEQAEKFYEKLEEASRLHFKKTAAAKRTNNMKRYSLNKALPAIRAFGGKRTRKLRKTRRNLKSRKQRR